MLKGTSCDHILPKYYYYMSETGLKKLPDSLIQGESNAEHVLQTLRVIGEMACKPNNGTGSQGFYRLAFRDNLYHINEKAVSAFEVEDFINLHPNYLYTEYIRPSTEFRKYSPHIHTLRLVTINQSGDDPRIVCGYIRIPVNAAGEANYIMLDRAQEEQYNLVAALDLKTGKYGNAKQFYINKVVSSEHHPDTGEKIEGVIPDFNRICETTLKIAQKFNTVEYMGFDYGITSEGVKCMEINSHSGIKYLQAALPFMTDPFISDYFRSKILSIGNLSEEEIKRRNNILR